MKAKVMLGILGTVLTVSAETVTWCGGASGSWSDAANWVKADESHGVPQPGDKVCIDAEEGFRTIDIDVADVSIGSIEFTGANSVELTGLGYQATDTGRAFHVRGGTVTNAAPVTLVAGGELCASNIVRFLAPVSVSGTGKFTIRTPKTDSNPNRQIYFDDRVTATGIEFVYPNGGTSTVFNGPVSARKFWADSSSSSHYVDLTAQGNDFGEMCVGYWGRMNANVHHAFPSNSVFRWNYYNQGKADGWSLHYYSFSADQVIDRIDSPEFPAHSSFTEPISQGRVLSNAPTTMPATLELRATADASTHAMLDQYMNLVYNSVGNHTQTFSNMYHKMIGSIEVQNGTVRNGGTNVFAFVKDLIVGAKGRYEIEDVPNRPKNPLTTLERLLVRPGGKIAIPSGLTISCQAFSADGTNYPVGTYTHEDVAAIEGDGKVKVGAPTEGTCYWIGAGETAAWTDATNWAGGVPTSESVVYVLGSGPDVLELTLPESAVLPKSLYLTGSVKLSLTGDRGTWNPDRVTVRAGARLEMPAGAAVETTSGCWRLDGGTLAVSGGSFTAKDFSGRFAIRGDSVNTGRVDVTSGFWQYTVKGWTSSATCQLDAGGEIRCTGGEVRLRRAKSSSIPLACNGGKILVSETGCLNQDGDYADSRENNNIFYSGSSSLKLISSGNDNFYLVAPAGTTERIVFKDDFDIVSGGAFDTFAITSKKTGHGILEIDSNLEKFSCNFGTRLTIGGESSSGAQPGFGELVLKRGLVTSGYRGVHVGSVFSSKWNTGNCYPGGKGVLRVEGGQIDAGADAKIGTETFFTGFTVGEAGMTHASGKHLFRGDVYLSGGKIAVKGNMVVGGARGEGAIDQTGGELETNYSDDYPMCIGLFGGTGSYTLGGGTFTSHRKMFIGGADKSVISGYSYLATYYPNYPYVDPTAEGLFSITGGTFYADKCIVLGARGKGVLSVTGTAPTRIRLYSNDLVLSNGTLTVEGKETTTSSTLRFALDETDKGVTPIEVEVGSDGTSGGTVVNTAGTRVEVDLGDAPRAKSSTLLVKCKAWEGPLPELVATGAEASDAVLKLKPSGLYVSVNRGLTLIVR